MKTLSLIVLVLSFTFTTPATARDKEGSYATMGEYSCGEWVKYRKEGGCINGMQQRWIGGYITAYNLQTFDVLDIMASTDPESVFLWMDKHCQENPLSGLADGMGKLTEELWPNRKQTKDD